METRMFFVTLFAIFVFIAVAAAYETPISYATNAAGTVIINTQVSGGLRLFFNGAEGNANFQTGSTVNITALLNFTGTVYLDINVTNWTTLNGTGSLTALQQFNENGVYNVTAWTPGDANHTASKITYFITISPPAPPGPPGGGGGGGGGGGAIGPETNVTKEKIFTVTVVTNDSVSLYGKNLDPGNYFGDTSGAVDFPITGVGMALRQDVSEFRILIETVDLPPGMVPLEQQYGLETPYKYLRVTVVGIDPELAFRTISLNFKVNKAWINGYNIDEGTVALYRYDNGWRPLSVIRTGGDDYYSTFNAGDVRAFSRYFVISGKQLIMPFRLFAPAYIVASMTYLQLAVIIFSILVLFILISKRRKYGELTIEY